MYTTINYYLSQSLIKILRIADNHTLGSEAKALIAKNSELVNDKDNDI